MNKKPEKPVEKPMEKPIEKPIEKKDEKTTELVDTNKKTVEDNKSEDVVVEETEAPEESQEPKVVETSQELVEKPSETPMNDTESIITHVVNTFKNSEDIGEALHRLATEIPVSVLLNFLDKFLAIIENVLVKIQNTLGIDMELKDPDKAMEEIKKNLPKIKFKILLTGVILKEILQDPEVMAVWTEFIDIFQNKFFQPFLIATLATLQEFEPQIEEQGDRVAKIMSKVVNRTGDAVSDAFGNVIAGVPYIGTVVAAVGSADNLAKIIIANINGWGELFLETSYRLSVTLKKVSPNGLMALDGAIDMVINAYNTYLAVKNSIDKWNALAQNVKFEPDQGYNADKLTEMMMSKAETAGTLPSQASPELPVAEAVEKKPIEPKKVPDKKKN